MDIYLDASRLGIYPPLFTSPSGDSCILFRLFHASVIKRFVRRENPERELQLKKKKFSDTSGEEDSMFVAETASLLDLFPELSKEGTEVFKT